MVKGWLFCRVALVNPAYEKKVPRREKACVKTMMVYSLFRVIVYTFILQARHLRSVDHHGSGMLFLK